jgi:hypothetical protein
LIFCISFLSPISFTSALIFMVSIFLITVGLVCPFLPRSSRNRV